MADVIHVQGLGKAYGRHWALRHATFTVRAGEAVGLLGANGAGKSTLIKCLLGLLRADEGQARLRAHPSYLPEQLQLPESLTPLDILRCLCRARGWSPRCAEHALHEAGLARRYWGKAIRHCSKGMRQRVLVAWCLCGEQRDRPLLLDEPMSGLDALGRAEVLGLLQRQRHNGAAILMSSHIVPDMVRLCDRVLLISGGRIREEVRLSEHSLAEAEALERKLASWQ
ncbi:MAG: ABC transporter ATP-binding protein [Zetaproteobacteria bacterium]|nr:MAG: ABC transporter ATP-binding protein [Zetaproteobacteria bacterium]